MVLVYMHKICAILLSFGKSFQNKFRSSIISGSSLLSPSFISQTLKELREHIGMSLGVRTCFMLALGQEQLEIALEYDN